MLVEGHWLAIKDGDPAAFHRLMNGADGPHYSFHQYKDNRRKFDKRFCGPGKSMVLANINYTAVFVWKKWIDPSGQRGIYNAVFHNDSDVLSSELIMEAEELAWAVWPGQRLYTYVDPKKVKSSNPGYCYKKAGWRKWGVTPGGKIVMEKLPNWGGK